MSKRQASERLRQYLKSHFIYFEMDFCNGTPRFTMIFKNCDLDFNNHIAVKSEYYFAVKEILREVENCDVTFNWTSILNEKHFSENIEAIKAAYFEQDKTDEHLA